MTDKNSMHDLGNRLPEAATQNRKGVSIVWLVPLLALFIGGWLVYKAISEKGPVITIYFETAEGIEAGKTSIKFKDVDVGIVDTVSLSPDLARVIVSARLVKEANTYLTEKTRFWVVRPRFGKGELSGLQTIVSGAYIAIDPAKSGAPQRVFTGLERPPAVLANMAGKHFMLNAETLGSLDIGSPVYFRQINAGEVIGYNLDQGGEQVNVKIFVHAPYDQYVYQNTRFWNASGLDLSLDAEGMRVDSDSFLSMVIGGIAFTAPANRRQSSLAKENQSFLLYPNREAAHQQSYALKVNFVLHFEESVRGLSVGAPVEFRGIQVGKVIDISLNIDADHPDLRIPVLIEFEPERILRDDLVADVKRRRQLMDGMVQNGLRAQLRTGNLLTGQLFVDLVFYPDASGKTINWQARYPEIPTVKTPLEGLFGSIKQSLDRISNLPIEETGRDIQTAVRSLNKVLDRTRMLMETIETKFEPEFRSTLVQARTTLDQIDRLVSSDSLLTQEANETLMEIGEAAKSIRRLMDYLEQHPDALIYGKGNRP